MMSNPAAGAAPAGDPTDRIPAYRWYLLAVLFSVGACNLVHRQILLMLIEPIRADLDLSDTQIGLLTGFSFAVVYATGCLLIARLADRTSRRMVLGVTIIVWSAMTALGGLAQSF